MSKSHNDAIREAYNKQRTVIGQWSALTVNHAGAEAQMLCRQNRIGRNHGPGPLELIMIKPGRVMAHLPVEAMAYSFVMSSNNDIKQRSVATAASEQTTLLWLAKGLPVVPHMKLSLNDAHHIRRHLPNELPPALDTTLAEKEAQIFTLSLLIEKATTPKGREHNTLYVTLDNGTVMHVHSGEYLPSDDDLPALIAGAAAQHIKRQAIVERESHTYVEPAPATIADYSTHEVEPAFQSSFFEDANAASITSARSGLRMG